MHAKDFFINKRANWEILESLAKLLPNFKSILIKSALTRIFEPIYLINKSAFMVTTEHVDKAWVSEFIGKEQCNYFNIIGIPVNIVSLEKVLFVGRWSNLIEETK